MNSIRERLLREVLARLSVAVAPVPVLRYPTVPVTREASPALLMFAEGDSITAHANNLVDRILILRDHVIKAMLEGLGAEVEEVVAEFNPVRGAYSGHGHSHSHGDGGHHHDHAHHDHAHGDHHAHSHAHGKHDHRHG